MYASSGERRTSVKYGHLSAKPCGIDIVLTSNVSILWMSLNAPESYDMSLINRSFYEICCKVDVR